jgi:hypothetical protein
MRDDRGPRITTTEHDRWVAAAALARTPEEVAVLRAELTRRWRNDVRVRVLAEALAVQQLSLSGDGGAGEAGGLLAVRHAESLMPLADPALDRVARSWDPGSGRTGRAAA